VVNAHEMISPQLAIFKERKVRKIEGEKQDHLVEKWL